MSAPSARAWVTLTALLALAALLGWPIERNALDWEPSLVATEPWRAFSAAAVHYSVLHLAANLIGALLVGALGVVADVPARIALAWLAAWPLTHLGLLLRPDLLHYGGLSGVLHAGVAAAALWLVVADRGRRRFVGAAILAGLCIKVVGESPWGPVLQTRSGWDISIAPFAHATGLVAGLSCALIALLVPRRPRPHD